MRALGCVVLGLAVLGGLAMTGIGGVEVAVYSGRHDVTFARPGDECGGVRVTLNIADGTRLWCSAVGPVTPPSDPRGLDGFSEEQNNEVLALAERLGLDGLSEADQRQIQDRVDEIAATVSLEEQKLIPGPSGVDRVLLGAMMLAAVGLIFGVQWWRERRLRRWYY
jgi:hypothetical protein